MKKGLSVLVGSLALVGCMDTRPQLPEDHASRNTIAGVLVCGELGKVNESEGTTLTEFYVRKVSDEYAWKPPQLQNMVAGAIEEVRAHFSYNPSEIVPICAGYVDYVPKAQAYLAERERQIQSNRVAMNNLFGAVEKFGSNLDESTEYTYRPMNLPPATINGMPQNQPTNIMVNTENGWVRKSCINNNNVVMCN